jgi:hypothetical protein
MNTAENNGDDQLSLLYKKLKGIRRHHLLNLWLTIPVVLLCLAVMTWIMKVWMPEYPVNNIFYISGALLIIIGSGFLMAYNYINAGKIDIYSAITDATMVYLEKVKGRIHKKLFLLLSTSTGFCIFLSEGLYLMVFRLISQEFRVGIISAYFGTLLALCGVFSGHIIIRHNRQYRQVLALIRRISQQE